jgi:Protein of unknown function (DUF3768)
MSTKVDKAMRIRELNDSLRRTFVGGKVILTSGVESLPPDAKAKVLQAVRSFDAFDTDNDPHKEHDFGSFDIDGGTFFFKVDYYSPDLQGGSEDPADPEETTRVLTIMFASEY